MNGKGDRDRTTDHEAYRRNLDRILEAERARNQELQDRLAEFLVRRLVFGGRMVEENPNEEEEDGG
jgi:hypothetical protein